MRDRIAVWPNGAAASTAAVCDSAILTYHSIDDSGSVISIGRNVFAEQMRLLAESPYKVAGLAEAARAPGTVALTFDDGYRNFLTEALPILSQFGFTATVFVVTGCCGSGNDWERGKRLPALPLMEWRELRAVASSGITLGAHTVTHPDLSRLAASELEHELSASRRMIEDACHVEVEQLAYPYVKAGPDVRAAAAKHFRWAVGTDLGCLRGGMDPLQLPRVDAYYLRSPHLFASFARGKARRYLAARHRIRQLREWASR